MSKKTIVKVLLKTSLLLRTKDTQNWKTRLLLNTVQILEQVVSKK
jgi:hypothetical protein